MAVLSSHFLDGTNGTHAAAVGVTLIHVDMAEAGKQSFQLLAMMAADLPMM